MPDLRRRGTDRDRSRIGLKIASVSLVALLAFATPAGAESLRDALGAAYESNPELQSQRAALRATDEGVAIALSGWRPTVQLDGEAGYRHSSNNISPQTRGSTQPVSVSAGVRQPLYRGGRTVANVDRAENEVQASRAGLLNAEQQVLLAAGTAYMNVLRDQSLVELNVNNERVLRRQLQATRDRFSVGEVTRTDVAQAEARLSQSLADRRTAEGNLESSRAAYERVVGSLPGALEQPSPVPDLPTTRDVAIERAASGNPAVVQAQYRHLAARDNVRSVTGELLPEVSLNAAIGRNYDGQFDGSRQTASSVTADMVVPLYQAGGVSARVRQAKQLASQRLIDVETTRRQAVEVATQSWERLVATRSRIEALETQVSAQEIALEGVEQEALVGTRTVLDVLDAEQELFNARANLVSARRDEVVAQLNLALAIGGLTAQNMALDVPYYDYEAYYREVRNKWFGLGN